MVVVKVELWPGGYEENKREIGRMTITNTGEGTSERGNYDVKVKHSGKTGSVKNYARKRDSVWVLVARALASVGWDFSNETDVELPRDAS